MTASPDAKDAATAVVALAREGRFDTIFEHLAPPVQALVTPDALRAAWDTALAQHGPVVAVGEAVVEPAHPGLVTVKVPVSCGRGGLTVIVAVAEGGALAGVQLAPLDAAAPVASWSPPGYVDPLSFSEREVTLGEGPLRVPGTLSLPVTPGPHPGVVMLAGSGPLDRDETIGPNKPLKDLAWGLAREGITVLRFDKVTFAHPHEVRHIDGFTLADEYLPAALAAVEVLRREPEVDPDRVFVAGHSLGATAAPRVAAADSAVAGLVILAGGAAPAASEHPPPSPLPRLPRRDLGGQPRPCGRSPRRPGRSHRQRPAIGRHARRRAASRHTGRLLARRSWLRPRGHRRRARPSHPHRPGRTRLPGHRGG